jgi:hypothetical protein
MEELSEDELEAIESYEADTIINSAGDILTIPKVHLVCACACVSAYMRCATKSTLPPSGLSLCRPSL